MWPARAAGGPCSTCRRRPQKIRAATGHLKGVRIAVMGCIVNGPGEMADADFGYVGGAPGEDQPLRRQGAGEVQHPGGEAVERLIDLIGEHGKWVDAPATATTPATA